MTVDDNIQGFKCQYADSPGCRTLWALPFLIVPQVIALRLQRGHGRCSGMLEGSSPSQASDGGPHACLFWCIQHQ